VVGADAVAVVADAVAVVADAAVVAAAVGGDKEDRTCAHT